MTELLNLVRARAARFITGSLLVSTAIVSAHAGNMYVYKDNSGQVLLTNVNPSGSNKYTKQVKVTYYPTSKNQHRGRYQTYTGKFTRISAPSHYRGYSTPSRSSKRNKYDHLIRASALRHGVDPALLKAMMHTESAFNPRARSHAGAQGLMQLMPATARRFKVRNAYNPRENIEGAAKYVAWLTKRFKGKVEHVVAGYNAGEGNVDKYGGIPPFRETRGYVKKVLGRYNSLYKNDPNLLGHLTTRAVPSQHRRIHTTNNQPTSFGTVHNQGRAAKHIYVKENNRNSKDFSTRANYVKTASFAQNAYDAIR